MHAVLHWSIFFVVSIQSVATVSYSQISQGSTWRWPLSHNELTRAEVEREDHFPLGTPLVPIPWYQNKS